VGASSGWMLATAGAARAKTGQNRRGVDRANGQSRPTLQALLCPRRHPAAHAARRVRPSICPRRAFSPFRAAGSPSGRSRASRGTGQGARLGVFVRPADKYQHRPSGVSLRYCRGRATGLSLDALTVVGCVRLPDVRRAPVRRGRLPVRAALPRTNAGPHRPYPPGPQLRRQLQVRQSHRVVLNTRQATARQRTEAPERQRPGSVRHGTWRGGAEGRLPKSVTGHNVAGEFGPSWAMPLWLVVRRPICQVSPQQARRLQLVSIEFWRISLALGQAAP
jgi:hypothetical protein